MSRQLKEICSDFELDFWPQIGRVSSYTMTSPERLLPAYNIWAIEHLGEMWRNLFSTECPFDNNTFCERLAQYPIFQNASNKFSVLRLDTDRYDSGVVDSKLSRQRTIWSGLLFNNNHGWRNGHAQAGEG